MKHYRPNVAAILRRPKSGKILVCQRRDFPDCWQFPQGGVDEGEDLIGALHREVAEEIGVGPENYRLTACRTGYRYKFPDEKSRRGKFIGQEQTYFLCDHLGRKSELVLDGDEFIGSKWIRPDEYRLDQVPEFKHAVIRRVFADFFEVELP